MNDYNGSYGVNLSVTSKRDGCRSSLLDELNKLAECILCPMDLMDSIDEYVNDKVIDELEDWAKYFEKEYNDKNLVNRIKELKRETIYNY